MSDDYIYTKFVLGWYPKPPAIEGIINKRLFIYITGYELNTPILFEIHGQT
jgi:hypothetical protein